MNTQVIEFLKANPNSNKGQIADAVNLRGLGLFNLLKKMVGEGQITVEGEGHDATYSIPSTERIEEQTSTEIVEEKLNDGEVVKEDPAEKQGDKKTEVQTEKKSVVKKQGDRSNGTYKFNGASHNKGKLIQAVVSHYCITHKNMTRDKLKEVFPDTLMKRFGIFQTVEKAREISGPKYDRYFFKDEMQIKLKHATIVTCNQITSENIVPFLKRCLELGYVVEVE